MAVHVSAIWRNESICAAAVMRAVATVTVATCFYYADGWSDTLPVLT